MADDGVCKSCSVLLKREKWNSDTDMVVCDNFKCNYYRNPVRSGERVKKAIKHRSKPELPDWMGGPYGGTENTDYAHRLQRLRSSLHTKDEETEIP